MAEETFDFFHAGEGEEYVFYRVPKLLFTEERFRRISTDARMLYGLMLDRLGLSQKNGWTDKNGRLYIYFTLEDVANALGVGRQKASQLLAELEKYKLILRKRQGLGKPNRIYVGRFTQRAGPSHFQKYENHTSVGMISGLPEVWNSYANNTDKNNTDKNKILSIDQGSFAEAETGTKEIDAMDRRTALERYFDEECGLALLIPEYPDRLEELKGIRDLLVDVCSSTAETIRVSGEDRPAAAVKGQLMKLNIEHIRYVLGCLEENTTRIANPKSYLLASLYNAPITMGSYYRARVNHDCFGT